MSKYFFYTGNAYPHKNLERLVEAVVDLNKTLNQEVHLKIASSRDVFVKRLEKSIKKLEAGKYVELLGFVPDERLRSLYKNSVAFVFPSLSEGFGLPGIEAMEATTLVLASDIPVFKEVYEDNAIYFNPLDFTSIEKTMRNVFEMDENTRKKRILKAQKFVKRYSWAKMARETLKIYEQEGRNSLRSG